MGFPLVPEQASTYAYDVDLIFWLLTGLTVFFTVLVLSLLLFFAAHFRRGSKVSRKNPSYSDLRLELAWSIGPLVTRDRHRVVGSDRRGIARWEIRLGPLEGGERGDL